MFFDHPTIASLTRVGLLRLPPPVPQDQALTGFVQSLREHNEAAAGTEQELQEKSLVVPMWGSMCKGSRCKPGVSGSG